MLVARFVPLIAALALGGERGPGEDRAVHRGNAAHRHAVVRRAADGVVVIIGALTFLPGLALGPIVEHLMEGVE